MTFRQNRWKRGALFHHGSLNLPGLPMLKSMRDSLVASIDAMAESRARPCGLAATNSGLALRALIRVMSVALSLGDVFSLVECKVKGHSYSFFFNFLAVLTQSGFIAG